MKCVFAVVSIVLLISCAGVPSVFGQDDEPANGGRDPSGNEMEEWEIRFSDGSNNRYHAQLNASYPTGLLDFEPIQPLESSSGGYSGGEPRQAILTASAARNLLDRVRRMAADTENHALARMMGTGQFRLTDSTGEKRFTLKAGPALQELVAFLTALLSPPKNE